MWNPEATTLSEVASLIKMNAKNESSGDITLFVLICGLIKILEVDPKKLMKMSFDKKTIAKVSAEMAAASILARQEAEEKEE